MTEIYRSPRYTALAKEIDKLEEVDCKLDEAYYDRQVELASLEEDLVELGGLLQESLDAVYQKLQKMIDETIEK